ncbi:vacuolar protein sorting-associated protein 45 [Entophlyctis sp. JEL0112]|nr:vacuolar protein sorting-associated protein 45 [Entophlyctis sp. JEL0112]
MDIARATQTYFSKMVSDVAGMKVLLLDKETTSVVSSSFTQSQLLSRQVFLVDRLENKTREKMKHLKCIVFVRPSHESIQCLVEELRDPCYSAYFLCERFPRCVAICITAHSSPVFSNTIKKSSIERLAEADEMELVREVQEFYADVIVHHTHLFSLNVAGPERPLYIENASTWDPPAFSRCVEAIVAACLAVKKKPVVRYEGNSIMAKKLGEEIVYQIQQEGPLFDFRRPDTPPLLLILDRRNDPITPLLSPWTYEAMVHEHFGISNGRVDLSQIPAIRSDLREIILSPGPASNSKSSGNTPNSSTGSSADAFYSDNMYLNLGDLGANIKTYVDAYQIKHKSSMNIESIDDMKRFMQDYPEFRKLSANVTKHVALVGELSRRVASEGLLESGEVEQSLACNENHNGDLKSIQKLLANGTLPYLQKLRLVILYAIRYERHPSNSTPSLLATLRANHPDPPQGLPDASTVCTAVLEYASSLRRSSSSNTGSSVGTNPSGSSSQPAAAEAFLARTKNAFKGLRGVENVYEQHQPNIVALLSGVLAGKIGDNVLPFVENGEGGKSKDKPQDVIVFMIGGTTYAESREIAKLNANTPGVRILIGGTTVHNSSSFLREACDSVVRWRKGGGSGGADGMGGQRIKTGRLD